MQVRRFHIEGPVEVIPRRFADDRGYFVETFNEAQLRKVGISEQAWVQDNHSYSVRQNTLRGLHYQLPPFAQAKLVRVVRGRIFDVAVDIRPGSKDFGKWIAVELTAAQGNQLYIPAGFAHGFLTLEPDCEITYKVTAPYSKECDRSIVWNDQRIAIDWPISPSETPVLSEKDAAARTLAAATDELNW